jgi:Phage ABA sandwich domain
VNIDELRAGREIDALIARQVMGWIEVGQGDGEPEDQGRRDKDHPYESIPPYSTDVSAAGEVQARFARHELRWDAQRKQHFCELVSNGRKGEAWAQTAPLAICRAALKAVGAL